MGKRGVVTDYAGNELYAGDLISYSARVGNRVRQSDAIILEVTTRLSPVEGVGNVLVSVLKVQPTGVDSGWGLGQRRTVRTEWITAEHVRLITTSFAQQREE